MVLQYPFQQVDVFSSQPFKGNPVCVFLESAGLTGADMQAIASWTNLSETTFVSPSQHADYKVRIFTPGEELPFAGHPTLGTAWAFWQSTGSAKNVLTQECGLGVVEITRGQDGVFFTLPKYRLLQGIDASVLGHAMGVSAFDDAMVINTGPDWIVAYMHNRNTMDSFSIKTDAMLALLRSAHATGVTVYAVEEGVCYVRTFFSTGKNICEDPVCGSGNAAVGVHIQTTGRTSQVGSSYEARQGSHMQRDGRIRVLLGEQIRVGGMCKTIFSGTAQF